MKKYILNSDWDIIPRNEGVELVHLVQPELSFTLAYFPNQVQFFTKILHGATRKELSTLNNTKIVSTLRARGVVSYTQITNSPLKTRDYLKLLQHHCVGAGKILTECHLLPAGHNPLAKLLNVSYSSGFAPACVPHQSSLSGGWGTDPDPKLAQIKSIVEGVERYALADYSLTKFNNTSLDDVKDKLLTTAQMCSSEEILNSAQNLYWQELHQISGEKTICAPLDFLHHPVNYTELQRPPVTALNISGVAGHQSINAAITNATLELCEHEALMVAWFGNRTTPTIRHTSLPQQSQDMIHAAEAMGWKIILKDISLDLVPVVMAVGLGPVGKRALTIGSCAAFTSRYATGKALSEVFREILLDESSPSEIPGINRENVNDIASHSYFYAHHKNLKYAQHLWENGEEIDATDILTHTSTPIEEKDECEYIIKHVLKNNCIETYFVNITPEEIRTQNIQLYIVRVIAPEMARLTVGYGRLPAQTERFKMLIKTYGTPKEQDTLLHPFS